MPPDWVTSEKQNSLATLCHIKRESGLSMVDLSVRYLPSNPDIVTTLVGAVTPEELEECVEAANRGASAARRASGH